jgi:osmotically inducible protein OsmC
MKRKASAVWNGDLKTGKGSVSTESKALSNALYAFVTRFENQVGTNPEELIAAALASCFSMALSAQLGEAGFKPQKIEVSVTVNIDKLETGWTVNEVHLQVKADVPGADQTSFEKSAQAAKTGCPISRLLNTKITMDAQIEK